MQTNLSKQTVYSPGQTAPLSGLQIAHVGKELTYYTTVRLSRLVSRLLFCWVHQPYIIVP